MKPIVARLMRRLIQYQLERKTPEALLGSSEQKLLRAFARAAKCSPAYRTLLAECKVSVEQIRSADDFVRLCPITEKWNTFKRFGIRELLASDIKLEQLASILTSSGHGNNGYAFGLGTRWQASEMPFMLDLGLQMAFGIDQHRTLLINCLPMGVTFPSEAVCVANVSVREDMACAIVEQAGALFEQIILCGDPLFLKRLCDYSQMRGIDWRKHRIHVIIGEETFTESFRDYLAQILCLNPDHPQSGLIGSSMGVGELGLNLLSETRESIALRRACQRNPALLHSLMGYHPENQLLPTLMVFNPLRTFVEVVSPDSQGQGDLLISTLDSKTPIPLLRYKTGDRAKFLPAAWLQSQLQLQGLTLPIPNLPLLALFGRSKDYLPDGRHLDFFKDVLYRDRAIAAHLSGAFRLSYYGESLLWEVQIRYADDSDPSWLAAQLQSQLDKYDTCHVQCYDYTTFPYGKTLDYERKFTYWPA